MDPSTEESSPPAPLDWQVIGVVPITGRGLLSCQASIYTQAHEIRMSG